MRGTTLRGPAPTVIMRRVGAVVVACVAALASAWVGADPALASPQAPPSPSCGTLTAGTAMTLTIGVKQKITCAWPAVAGHHVTFDISSAKFNPGGASGSLTLHDPAGRAVQLIDFSGTDFLEDTPATTGTYTAVFAGNGLASGTVTATFAKDITGTLTSGTAVTVPLRHRGQHAVYTWPAVANHHVTFDMATATFQNSFDPNLAGGSLAVNTPTGTNVALLDFNGTNFRDYTPLTTGTYTAVFAGNAGSTGTIAATFAKDLTGTLTSGAAVTIPLRFRGQQAVYTWPAVDDHHVTFDIATATFHNSFDPNLAGGSMAQNLPTGPNVDLLDFSGTNFRGFTPVKTGNYTAVFSGNAGSTGTISVTFAKDITGSFTVGATVTTALRFRGQQAVYTWPAVAGRSVTFDVSAAKLKSTFYTGPGFGDLALYNSVDAEPGTDIRRIDFSGPALVGATPTTTGTYKAVFAGNGGATGTITTKLFSGGG